MEHKGHCLARVGVAPYTTLVSLQQLHVLTRRHTHLQQLEHSEHLTHSRLEMHAIWLKLADNQPGKQAAEPDTSGILLYAYSQTIRCCQPDSANIYQYADTRITWESVR